jgi:hypothetical protein
LHPPHAFTASDRAASESEWRGQVLKVIGGHGAKCRQHQLDAERLGKRT